MVGGEIKSCLKKRGKSYFFAKYQDPDLNDATLSPSPQMTRTKINWKRD